MRRELLLLREMRDAAVAIRDLIGDRSAEQVEADRLRRSALLWHFTVLGKAASQMPPAARDSYPEIAWRAPTRLRNRIVLLVDFPSGTDLWISSPAMASRIECASRPDRTCFAW